MIAWLYKWLPIIFLCHCRDDRSFHYKGRKFPICARCTGELIGMIAGILLNLVFVPDVPVLLFLSAPLVLDGGIQLLTSYESTNIRRLWTGVLFGYALMGLLWLFYADAYSRGMAYGKVLLDRRHGQ